ncbi:carbohydrate sulfotransferase 3-like [Lytechinus pictus]|uniref:carbohydrate sulfotransferase 3-like n=1 Tax=Lytechinus pictus TaxID=7653 RepID=UPI0030B9B737
MAFRRCVHVCSVIFALSQMVVLSILFNKHENFRIIKHRRVKLVSSHRSRLLNAPVIRNIEEQEAVNSHTNMRSPSDVFGRDKNKQYLDKGLLIEDLHMAEQGVSKSRNYGGGSLFDHLRSSLMGLSDDTVEEEDNTINLPRLLFRNVPPVTSPKLTILLAQWRFGSSIVGELFNQNLDAFYLFEPLWTLNRLKSVWRQPERYTRPSTRDVSRQILRELAHCKFNSDFVWTYSEWHPFQNRAICNLSPECLLSGEQWFENFCRTSRENIATKIIRVDLEDLRPLVEMDDIDLRIIHLVRDPRAAAASRIDYITERYQPDQQYFRGTGRLKPLGLLDTVPDALMYIQEMRENNPTARGMCKWIERNAKTSRNHLPEWLQGHYKLIRYEDFAVEPVNISKEIYEFIGLPFPKYLEHWIEANTNAIYRDGDIFSNRRNSLEAATHWIVDLSELEIRQIEKECRAALKLLDYKLYDELKYTL